MMELSRGQRTKLGDLLPGGNTFSIALELVGRPTFDVACFGLDEARKLSDERYMVFFNQPASPCGAVKLAGTNRFDFDLSQLPPSIASLTLTLAIDGDGQMSQIGPSCASVSANGSAAANYAFDGNQFAAEKALMLMEIYRKDGVWRLQAVGQGFNGGLDALVQHFGGTVEQKPSAQVEPPPPPKPKVSLSKITLEKKGDKISLEKRGAGPGHGRIECNLNWSQGNGKSKGGLLGGLFGSSGSGAIDLDLGCMIEMANGERTVVQALGNRFGDFEYPPYVNLAGDDRSGANTGGEFLYINGDHLSALKRVCVFAFIYEGVANWGQADGVVTVSVPGHPPIEVRLDNADDSKNMCGIAMLENVGGELRVTKLGEYFAGHQELDQRYGWGFKWVAGSKD